MNNIETIPLTNLAYSLIPVVMVIFILIKWKLKTGHALYAMTRMLVQLLAVGYVLNSIFASESAEITLFILMIMLLFSSWIALDTVKLNRKQFFHQTTLSLIIASGITLISA